MVARVDTALVSLWGRTVGAVSWMAERGYAIFEFDPSFPNHGLDIAPLHMGLEMARRGDGRFSFPGLSRETYRGLPGLLADALPDKFGNAIIDAWLARNGRDSAGFSPVERLCYLGRRGMGALEFSPAVTGRFDEPAPVEVADLVELAQQITGHRDALGVQFSGNAQQDGEAMLDILRVGTSAGGARPKAVIAINEAGQVISGQGTVPAGYDYWLLKFDGVTDMELGEPKGYGRIEYAYSLMARAAGIDMAPCRLLEENGRAHFMTRRFDRIDGQKLHMQSLCGVAHYDFNLAGAYSYEQVFEVMRRLRLSRAEALQQYRRMVFNVVARNLDDHTRNITFLMGRDGRWRLSPAYDVIYAHNPQGRWTSQHQLSLAGKRDHFTRGDLLAVGESIGLSRSGEVVEEVIEAVSRWPEFAQQAGVAPAVLAEIGGHHRLAW